MQTLCPPYVRRWALGLFLVLCGLANLPAATSVGSTQSGRWTLAGSPYLVTDDVFVPTGQTLEIDPGVVVQFQGVEDALVVDGILLARGTSASPIVFTSAAAAKAPGQWESIYFRAANTNSVMQNCVIEYGGSQGFADQNIWVANGSPAFLNCVIRGSRVDGLLLLASDARVEGCQFTGNGNNALAMRADSLATLRNNTASGNKVNAIAVFGGSFTRTGTWTRDEIPYTVVEDLFVGSGQTLTLEAGTTVQFQGPEDALVVDGALVARGTGGSPIVFTSAATTKAPGQWESLYFRSANTNSVLQNCVIEYGGSQGFAEQNIWVANGSPAFLNCVIRGSRVDGLLLLASDARVEGCQFTGNGNNALAMRADSLATLRNNTASGNKVNAIAVFGGSFTRTGTWTRDEIPYTVVEDLFVGSGQTLTLEPGITVQFQGVEDALVVDGTLVAMGTTEAPIRFTSDDAVKTPGQWETILFRGAANTNSVMAHCIVEYGGSSGFAEENIRLENASPVIRDTVIQHSRLHGIRVVNADPRLENCGFTNNGATNGGFAIALRADSLPRLSRNHGAGNGYDAIAVYGVSFTRSGTWNRDDLPYTVVEDLFIGSGQTLTLEPGAIVQFQGVEDSLVVDGTLIANGTTEAPIRFTSDDVVKAPGQWEGIVFRNGSANSVLSNCIVEYGAAQGFIDESIRFEGVSPSVVNTTIRDSRFHGMTIVNADPRVENCVFLRNGATNGGFAIAMRADSLPRLRNNSGSGNGNNAIGVYGFSATRTGTWTRDGLPYTIVEDLVVSSGQTLTLEPGLSMQFQGREDGLFVDGTLIARGTAGAPIRFTSDDAVKAPGQWEAIYFRAANANSVLEHCIVEFAGGDGEGNIVSENSSPRITNTTVQNGAKDGISVNGAAPQITASRLTNNGRDGLRAFNGAKPVINNSTIVGNAALAVNNFDTSVVVNARNNFWGDASGPMDNLNTDGRNQLNPNGKGGKVSEYVDWSGFGATDPAPGEQPVVPHLAVTPLALDFGPVTAGQQKALPLTLQSTGTGPVTVKSVTGVDARFQVMDLATPFAVATNTSRILQVQFRPDAAGDFAGTLVISSDDPDASAISVTLKGSGMGGPVSTNCIAAPSGLVAWWSGDRDASDGAGTNHAVLKNGVTFSPGKVSGAFVFDGVSQSVDTPLDVQPSAMPSTTWEAWVYPTRLNFGVRQQILCNDDGGYDRGLLIESGTTNFGVFTGGGAWQPAPATPDQWQHVAVVFTPGNIEFYKNGVRFSLGSAPAGQNSGLKLMIGRNPGFGEYFKGMIDEVSVYNRALSAAEIQAIFNAGEAGKCKSSEPIGAPFLHVAKTSLDFGEVQAGQGKDVLLSVDNSGTATLVINSIAVDGAVFRVVSPATPITLAAGAATNLTVRFSPVAAGAQSGKLVFTSNEAAGRGPVEVVLSGRGVDSNQPGAVSFSDSFARANADRCALGRADNALGGTKPVYYLPIFPTGGNNPANPIGASIAGGALQNNGLDYGGVQFTENDRACASGASGLDLGQDLNLKLELLAPTDAAGNISQAGPYLRARAARAGDGINGGAASDPASGYWVQLHSTGEVKVRRLHPLATIATSGRPLFFDATVTHAMEIAAQGTALQVALDGKLLVFEQNGSRGVTVVITNTLFGAGGVAFGAEDNRGSIGGQRVDNLKVTPFQSLASLPVQDNFNVVLPRLRILDEASGLVLAWPAAAVGFRLESADSLSLPVTWRTVTNQVTISGADIRLPITPDVEKRFYRLSANGGPGTTGRAVVPAVQGGTITLPGGNVSFNVPPGALEQDTEITVTHHDPAASAALAPDGHIVLSPSGLVFKKPATLSIKLPAGANPAAASFHMLSGLNPRLDLGSEISYFQEITNTTYNATTAVWEVPINHFSILTYIFEDKEDVYAVLDIPAKYLKPADLIFALTGAGSWVPGHVGMYLGTLLPNKPGNDGVTIIECTSEARDLGQVSGVQLSVLERFRYLQGQHIYMGPRRPRFEVTDDERRQIANWALSKAGVLYDYLGSPFISSGGAVGYTCVGFTEAAYESAGKSIVPGIQELLLIPLRQFSYTRPVDEITMEVGEGLAMAVSGVVKRPSSYKNEPLYYDLTVAADPENAASIALSSGRATLGENNQFIFRPVKEDGELTHIFKFTVDAGRFGLGKVTQSLFVHVKDKTATNVFVRQDPPVIQVEPAFSAGDLVVTNTSAYVSSNAKLYLRWPEPPQQVITGQKFDMTITPDPTTAAVVAGQSSTSPSVQRRLYGDVNIVPQLFADSFALIGYSENGNKQCGFDRCFDLKQVPITRSVTVGADEFTVKVNVAAYGGLTFGGNGERRGSVTWTYKRK